MGVARVLIIALVAGCYSPSAANCSYKCGAGGACPSGLSCDTNGFCREPGGAMCSGSNDDGGMPDVGDVASDANLGPYATAVQQSVPIAYWRLSDQTDSQAAKNEIAGSPNATNVGASFGQPGFLNGDTAVQLSAAGMDRLTAGDFAQATFTSGDAFTIETWVKLNQVAANDRVIVAKLDGTNGWELGITGGGQVQFRVCNGSNCPAMTAPPTLAANDWYYVVATFGANLQATIYVEAAEEFQANSTVSPGATTAPLNIGCRLNGANPVAFFDGLLDEIAIYDKVLTQPELMAHYNLR